MNRYEQSLPEPEFAPVKKAHEKAELKHIASIVAEKGQDFKSGIPFGVSDRKILENVFGTKGEIGGGTAVVAEYALRDYVDKMRAEVVELTHAIEGRINVNADEAREKIEYNRMMIGMIEKNCLQTLGGITDKIISPEDKKE